MHYGPDDVMQRFEIDLRSLDKAEAMNPRIGLLELLELEVDIGRVPLHPSESGPPPADALPALQNEIPPRQVKIYY